MAEAEVSAVSTGGVSGVIIDNVGGGGVSVDIIGGVDPSSVSPSKSSEEVLLDSETCPSPWKLSFPSISPYMFGVISVLFDLPFI